MLTHVDKKGNAKMVDISSKKILSEWQKPEALFS
jgi:molybdenum cofactor biosynthesis enzyme